MLTFLTVIHVLVALFLIFFVLLQDSKGGAMGMLGGGSSSSVFGASGAVSILVKATRWIAILFAITCIGLTVIISGQKEASLLDGASAAAPGMPANTLEKIDNKDKAAEQDSSAMPTNEKSEEPKK